MRHFRTFVIGICSLWAFACLGQMAYTAEDVANVKGKVVDLDSGLPVGATINYEMEPYATGIGFYQSDPSTGDYHLVFLKGKTYKVVVSAPNYTKLTTRIEASEDFEKDLLLSPVIREIFTLENLIFQRGQALIDETSYQSLDELVELLKENENLRIQLEGHTDFAGNEEANMRLSQDRVEAVKDYLVKKGIKRSRIRLKAFGGSQPISRERTEEAKTANRRVEVRILNAGS